MTTNADTTVSPAPPPAVVARNLAARSRRGWIYRNVHADVPSGGVAAVAGPAGSGRTALLLTFGGRLAPAGGELSVLGHPVPAESDAVRRHAAVARVAGVAEPEPMLRVSEHVTERRLVAGRYAASGEDFAAACEALGLPFTDRTDTLVEDLPAVRVTLLAVALATLERPALILLDDMDAALSGADQRGVWEALRRLTTCGVTVVAGTTDEAPVAGLADVVIALPGDGADEPGEEE